MRTTGWETIEDYMKRYDEGMVTDFANDIDTLLVFVRYLSTLFGDLKLIKQLISQAGLFSAVLTAFLAQSYQSLQPDTSAQLLGRISQQLGSFTIAQSFVNSTFFPDNLPPFQPPSSAIAINSLWFLSLVFSLAAALFGILAKEWLREFLQWNAVLASPRENVLIRQIRFEEWQGWHVSTLISAIPALVEIAVILFLVGMAIFVWTL